MPALTSEYYDINPVGVIDRNKWTLFDAEVNLAFNTNPVVYTPLVDWTDISARTGALNSEFFDILEGDVNHDDIEFTTQYLDEALTVDSRSARLTVRRYADKVQLAESSNWFQQWKGLGGQNGRDWRPLLRGLLGRSVTRKIEQIAKFAFLSGPKEFWTYSGGATSFAGLDTANRFDLNIVNEWRLRLGATGSPVIPGDAAAASVAIIPPGAQFDLMEKLQTASGNEAALWRDAQLYRGSAINYEIGTYKGVRFVVPPNDRYGINPAVLYNAGSILAQYKVTAPIKSGDGSPDPEAESVDGVWYVGQKDVTHYIQLESTADMSKFALNDLVSIHTKTTNYFGVTNGVDVRSGKTIVRRIVKIDVPNKRLSFDRPVSFNYDKNLATSGTPFYAYVTKGVHVGMCLVVGARGGVIGNVNRPITFHEPQPVDDFGLVWRFTWHTLLGMNVVEPNYFEVHFAAVSVPKPGGVVRPPDLP